MPLGASRRQRQHWIESVKRLNRRLSSTQKHGRVLRRIHVQTDDVCGLLFKPWIVGGQVAVQPMRLQPRLCPHSLHGRVAEPPALPPSSGTANAWNHRKASAAPCARCGLAPPQSPRAFDYLCDAGPDSPSLSFKTLLPARYRGCGRLQALRDLAVTGAIGQRFPELPTSQTRKAPSCNCSF
jgi:hypothetical protein